MNETPAGQHLLGDFSATLVHLLRGWMEGIFGPGAGREALGSLTWAGLGVVVFFVLLTLAANALAAFFFRKKIKAAARENEEGGLRRHYFLAVRKPVYFLVWIAGLYLAATPLLLKLHPGEDLYVLCGFLGKVAGITFFSVLVWLFVRFTRVLEMRMAQWAFKTPGKLDNLLVPLVGKSLRIIVPVLAVIFALPLLGLPEKYAEVLGKGGSILLILAVAAILVQVVKLGERAVLTEYDITAADNLRARKVYTQVHVISKTLYFLISLFTTASVLMLFKEVQHFGASILASAGVVGVILGFAAQKTIANLFAGFQLALAQPIRLDDVVIVEGEWGRIEEITLTYVVVHIWDDRRLIVPLSHFIEKPFQNWTRTSAELFGTVFVWVDYTLPLEEVRRALKEIIEPHPLWDRRFWSLQVTDSTERTMQIRVLATSADSSKAWDLRCDIREKLIAYLQKNHPQCLPRLRAEMGPPAMGGKDSGIRA